MKECFSEFLGTCILVFAGTSAIVVNDLSGGVITQVGIALVFGLVVAAIIYTLGDVSGAHVNPAVTVGFWLAGRFPGAKVPHFVGSQLLGALTASMLVLLLFAEHRTLGATLPAGSGLQSLILETILSFILMLTVISVSTGAKEKGITAGLAIGAVVGLEALFAGPVSGASMNPARSAGPALVSGELESLWIYLVAPFAGAAFAVFCCRCLRDRDCCR
jgi:aquaporin Z